MRTREQVETTLDEKIPRDAVEQRSGGGSQKLSYLPTHYVIDRLNKVFGNLGWDSETVEMILVSQPGEKAAYRSKVRIKASVPALDASGDLIGYTNVIKEGSGWGSDKSTMNAHEMAVKEAESDALKRAAMKFGMSLGLALYSKDQENVEEAPKAATPVFAPTPKVGDITPFQGGPSRDVVNKGIASESNVVLAKAGLKDSPERAAKLTELKALVKAHGADTKEQLTDEKARELLAKLKEMNS